MALPRPPETPPRGPTALPQTPPMAQDGPKMAQDGPKRPQDGPKRAQDGPNRSQDASGPKVVTLFGPTWTPKGAPKTLKLDTWDLQKVTTSTRILNFFTFEAMSKQESKVRWLKTG